MERYRILTAKLSARSEGDLSPSDALHSKISGETNEMVAAGWHVDSMSTAFDVSGALWVTILFEREAY